MRFLVPSLVAILINAAGLGCTNARDERAPKKPPVPHGTIRQPNRPPDVTPISSTGSLEDMDMPELIQALGHADFDRRQQAVDLLLSSEDSQVVEQLARALDDENYHVRAGIVFALGCFGERATLAIDRLEQIMQDDPRESVRDAAAFAIDAIQQP